MALTMGQGPQFTHPKTAKHTPNEFPEYLVICYSIPDTSNWNWFLSFFFYISILLSANFSQPEIRLIANQTEKSNIINLTCSSIQGYPEPQRMYVSLNTTNSSSTYDAVMKKSQSNITELYNVSISVSFPIPPETNVTIFCALQLEPTNTILSQPYNIGKLASPDCSVYHV